MKGPHRELCARLSNALPSDDANGYALLHELACGQILAIAVAADAIVCLAGERRTDSQGCHSTSKEAPDKLIIEHLASLQPADWFGKDSAHDPAAHIGKAKCTALLIRNEPTLLCSAVLHRGPDLHPNLDQLSCQ